MAATHAYAGIPATRFVRAKAGCRSYQEYKDWLVESGAQYCLGQIAANVTVTYVREYDAIAVNLYYTRVLIFLADGRFSADHGGHLTPTAVTRLNQFGPPGVRIWRHRAAVVRPGPCGSGVFYPCVLPPEPPPPPPPPPPLASAGRRRRTLRRLEP